MKKTTYVFSIKRLYPAFFIMFCLISVPCFSQTLSGASVEFVELNQTKTVNGSDQSLDATPAQATYDVEFKVAGENYYVDVDGDKIIIGARNGSVISAVTSITFNFSGGTFSSIIGASFNSGASTGTNTSGVSASFTATSVTISGIQNKDFAQGHGLGNMGTVVFDITTAGVANTAPVIGGTTAGQSVNDNGIISPFSSITTTDADGDNLSATITLDDNAKGILTGTGLSGTGPYTIVSTTPADLQTKLRALSFNPTDNRTSTTETTTFTIVVNDGTDTDTDNTTTVISSAVAPSVSSVNVPANATYITGQNLDFTVNFNENITVSTTGGDPQITITIGATTHQATYINGNGTSALLFRHTVFTGELDTDGIAVGSLAANGSTLKDSGGKDANLTLNSVGSTAAVLVDAVPPSGYTVQIDQANVNASNETAISFTLFDAEVGTVYNYTIRNNIGGTSISGSGNIVTSNQQITNIDVSSLDDGNLTVSVFLTDSVGNIGNNVTHTATKNTAIAYTPNANNILYVNKNVTGGNGSGDSWANAIPELADALFWANNNQDPNWITTPLQIWVAKGTYLPDEGRNVSNNDRNATFQLVTGVEIYGGFEGVVTEIELSDRDWISNETILSGNIDGDNTLANNSYHVVTGSGADFTAILDGFTVTKGNANGSNPNYGGGGIFIYNSSQNGSPTLSNLRITRNEASHTGGGIFSYNSSFKLFNVEISENTAKFGGGIYTTVGHPKLLNVALYNNSANRTGGGINSTDEITLTNLSIYNNLAGNDGGGLYNTGEANIQNSIFWGNSAGGNGNQTHTDALYGTAPTYKNSLIQDNDLSATGIGNLDGTAYLPGMIFADFSAGDYTLAPGSVAINKGGNQVYSDADGDLQNDNDLAGNPRLDATIIDLGAYEFQGASTPPTPNGYILYVDNNVNGGNGSGDSWNNAIPELADALKWAYQEHQIGTPWSDSNPLEIWVAAGTYHPDDGNRATDNDRNETFQLISGVKVYGGFEGNEIDLSDRDWNTHITVLSGDIDGNDTSDSDGIVTKPNDITGFNSYSVVTGSGADNTAFLDGFIITSGSADDESAGIDEPKRNGGGIYNYDGSPTLTNLIITGNITEYRGGGVFNFNSSPVLTNVTIKGNRTGDGSNTSHYGGGIANISGSSVVLMNSKIIENSAQAGGGVYNDESPTTLINTLIAENEAINSNGGGIFNFLSSSTELINVSISGNNAGNEGGGIFNAYGSLYLKNTVVWGNIANGGNEIATQYGNVNFESSLYGNDTGDVIGENSFNTTDTLNDDPKFSDISNSDYTLANNSPAINTGDNSIYTGDINNDTDLAGNPRLYNNTIDIGAFESQNAPPTAICKNITVQLDANGQINITASDVDDGSSDLEGNVTLSIDKTDFDCSNIGDNTVILTVEDSSGATATCQAIVTVKDVTAPAPDNLTLADITAECQVLATDVPIPTATDNCGATIQGTHNLTFPISTQGTHVITWTFDDGNGNADTQTQNIIINDVTAPTPDNLTLADITAECQVLATDVPIPTATDNCGATIQGTHNLTFPISTQGTHVITWTFDDGNGNADTQTQNIIINDVTTPTPDNLTLADITAECQVLATDVPIPTATDNCGATIQGTHNLTFPISTQGTHV
ncbi:MAG: beta strand repeat-containing protein, partial [Mesonia hippocampi]|uniref:beta strand repeat-containing protein n=1 Tax=Mesonia hippocampi TaxID=1628250 RepID=UPI003F9D3A24